MAERKKLLLRLDPEVYEAVARWAADDIRSVNAQIEYALRRALRAAGRYGRGAQGPTASGPGEVDPDPAETGAAETGPAETGPAGTGPDNVDGERESTDP